MKQRCVPRAYHEGKKDLNMEKEYRLSTKAILQMVMHLRKAGIYGVKSIPSNTSSANPIALSYFIMLSSLLIIISGFVNLFHYVEAI